MTAWRKHLRFAARKVRTPRVCFSFAVRRGSYHLLLRIGSGAVPSHGPLGAMADGPEVPDWNTSEDEGEARPSHSDGGDHRASSRGRTQSRARRGSEEAAPPKGKNKGKDKGKRDKGGSSSKGGSRKGKSKGRSASRKGDERQQKGKKGKNSWNYEPTEHQGKGKHKEMDMQDMINQAVQNALSVKQQQFMAQQQQLQAQQWQQQMQFQQMQQPMHPTLEGWYGQPDGSWKYWSGQAWTLGPATPCVSRTAKPAEPQGPPPKAAAAPQAKANPGGGGSGGTSSTPVPKVQPKKKQRVNPPPPGDSNESGDYDSSYGEEEEEEEEAEVGPEESRPTNDPIVEPSERGASVLGAAVKAKAKAKQRPRQQEQGEVRPAAPEEARPAARPDPKPKARRRRGGRAASEGSETS